MAVTSGFFNSLYGDRKYNAEQFSALFNGLINDGVFANIGTAFGVQAATGNGITVGIGRAWFNGIWVDNDAILPMTCNDPEVLLDRIDALVIEINRTEAVRAGRIIFVRGTASGSPSRPVMTHDDGVDQYPLAYIRRKAGVSDVVQADITNAIGTSECPYVTGILDTVNIDNLVAQWESEFDIWFDDLQVELSGDVAANLASQILELNSRFNELAETRSVTVELEDSSYDTIEDSNGDPILGTTAFDSEGSGNVVVEVPSEPANIEDLFKVGDTLTTVRSDLGDNWALCNGATLSRDDNPEIASVSPVTPAYEWTEEDGSVNIAFQSSYSPKIVYGNGYFVKLIYGHQSGNFSTKYAYIAYSTKIDGPWTAVKLMELTAGSDGISLNDLIYANGYFVAVGGSYVNSSEINSALLWYATTPSSWTRRTMWTASNGRAAKINCVKYLNDRFFIGGVIKTGTNECSLRIAYANTPNTTWVTKDVYNSSSDSASGEGITDIIYAQDQYVAIGNYSYYASGTWNTAIAIYGENLEDAWTVKTLYRANNGTAIPKCIAYVNGKIIIGGVLYDGQYCPFVSVFDSPSAITTEYFILDTSNTSSNCGVKSILEINGYLTLLAKTIINGNDTSTLFYCPVSDNYTADSFAKKYIANNGSSNISDEGSITECDGYLMVSPSLYNVLWHFYIDKSFVQIPSISISDSTYTFIKVRSE